MFVVIREYQVRKGPEAPPAGYLDTQLLLGDQPRHCLTSDHRDSAQAYAGFLDAAKARHAQVDRLGDALTLSERRIGTPC